MIEVSGVICMDFHEIHKFELFDAYDINEQKLNIDLVRGKSHEDGLYHIVVEIITMNEKGEILLTKRHPRKNYGLYWEITGGSILKGEDVLSGAIRELEEETGIKTTKESLKLIYKEVFYDGLFRGFFHQVDMTHQTITLQSDETIEYQWVSKCDFVEHICQTDFIPHTRARILHAWEILEPILFCE